VLFIGSSVAFGLLVAALFIIGLATVRWGCGPCWAPARGQPSWCRPLDRSLSVWARCS